MSRLMKFNFAPKIDPKLQSTRKLVAEGGSERRETKGRKKNRMRAETSETVADGKREEGRNGRVEGGRELLVSQTVRKRLTPRIKWYRNETIVEQMPGHKTTASSFPFPIAALSTPVEQAN